MKVLTPNRRSTRETSVPSFFTEGLTSKLVVLACAGFLVTVAEAQTADTTFNVSATFADNNSTPLAGTVTINTSTGAIDDFNFNIPAMTTGGPNGPITLAGAVFTPQTATAGFFTNPSLISFQLKGATPEGETLFLFIPQSTLTSYAGGPLLQSVFLNGQTFNTGYQSGPQSNPFIGTAGNGLVSSSDTTFNVSATFADNNSTPWKGTVTINSATGAIDGFFFNIPSMTTKGPNGPTTLPGAVFTPQTATGSFFTGTPNQFSFMTFQLFGAPPFGEELFLYIPYIPQGTLACYSGGPLLQAIGTNGSGYQSGAQSNPFINIAGNGSISGIIGASSLACTCQVIACGKTPTASTVGCVDLSTGGIPSLDGQDTTMFAVFAFDPDKIAACNFVDFNWQQQITLEPAPSPFFPFDPSAINPQNLSSDGSLRAPPGYSDPPPGGGYTYELDLTGSPDYAYPFYLNALELSQFETTNTLSFSDRPANDLLPAGAAVQFTTSLVGVLPCQVGVAGCVTGTPSAPLFTWNWQSTFNGTAGGVHSQTKSVFPIDPNSGTGGVLITAISGHQLNPIPRSNVTTIASGLAYSRVTQTFDGTITITNSSNNTISMPMQIVFMSVTPGVTLVNVSGTFAGNAYITAPLSGNLAPGQSVTVPLQFKNPSNGKINFTPAIYSGSLN